MDFRAQLLLLIFECLSQQVDCSISPVPLVGRARYLAGECSQHMLLDIEIVELT